MLPEHSSAVVGMPTDDPTTVPFAVIATVVLMIVALRGAERISC